jgi:hypothetical protein
MAGDRQQYPSPWGPTEIPSQFRLHGNPGDLSVAPDVRPAAMCARCHLVVHAVTSGGQRFLVHSGPAFQHDHEPEPVPQTTESWRNVCDACGDMSSGGKRFWFLPSEDPQEPDDPTPWELCRICQGLFESGAVKRLVRARILPLLLATVPPDAHGFAKQMMLTSWLARYQRIQRSEALPSF